MAAHELVAYFLLFSGPTGRPARSLSAHGFLERASKLASACRSLAEKRPVLADVLGRLRARSETVSGRKKWRRELVSISFGTPGSRFLARTVPDGAKMVREPLNERRLRSGDRSSF